MHIVLRILITFAAAVATIIVVIALGGQPGAATGIPGAIVAYVAWWLTGRARDARS